MNHFEAHPDSFIMRVVGSKVLRMIIQFEYLLIKGRMANERLDILDGF